MIDLGADESQLDTPVVYASARAGTATLDPNDAEQRSASAV